MRVRCPVCLHLSVLWLSVTLVYCGQTVGWIKMKLGMEVGLGPSHIVLDGDPAPPPRKGHRGTAPPIFGLCLLWPNGWMNEDATWHEFKLGLGPGHIVLDGDPAPSQKGHCPNFRPNGHLSQPLLSTC